MLPENEWIDLAKAVVRADADAVLAATETLGETFVVVAKLFLGCRGKILVTGAGTSGAIASRAAHNLSVVGTPAFYLSPSDGLNGGLGVLGADDWVLALSKGGGSAELNEFCRRAKTLCAGVVSVTADPRSELAALSDCVLALTMAEDADLGGIVATGSSLATAAVTDALVEVCRAARGYGWDKLLFTHPSGAVGRDAQTTLERLERGD